MCEFCHQHGEGKAWYLQAKNYSEDLASDRRALRKLEDITRFAVEDGPRLPVLLRRYQRAPRVIQWLVGKYTERNLRKTHHGQVVPMEDLRVLLSQVVTSVVRLPCICRKGTTGKGSAYCLAITAKPGTWDETCRKFLAEKGAEGLFTGAEQGSMETLSPTEALALLERCEGEGLVHTLWTFQSPFVGGLCNCDPGSCMALKTLFGGIRALDPAEFKIRVDEDRCGGCGECVGRCPFGAMGLDAATGRAGAAPLNCYGCGLCRTVCPDDALSLVPRGEDEWAVTLPVAALS